MDKKLIWNHYHTHLEKSQLILIAIKSSESLVKLSTKQKLASWEKQYLPNMLAALQKTMSLCCF